MSTITIRTIVYDSPGTPLGLCGRSQWVVHHCDACRVEVPTAELLAHAQSHGEPTRWWEVGGSERASNSDEA